MTSEENAAALGRLAQMTFNSTPEKIALEAMRGIKAGPFENPADIMVWTAYMTLGNAAGLADSGVLQGGAASPAAMAGKRKLRPVLQAVLAVLACGVVASLVWKPHGDA